MREGDCSGHRSGEPLTMPGGHLGIHEHLLGLPSSGVMAELRS